MAVHKYVFPSRKEWLKGRKGHIGGSDASACVGMNPYKDNVQLWEEKMGLAFPEDISDRDYVQYGTEAEAHLRALFAMDFPEYQVIYEENNMFLNDDYPWMHASLDGELVVGKDAYFKRAESNAAYDGFEAGIIVKNEAGQIEYRPGTLKLKEEELIGGYAEVFRKDRSHSFRAEVSFDEYAGRKKDGTLNSQWSKKPATMIRKVAAVQALREAFPQSFVGMYVAEEMGASEPDYTAGDIIEPQIQAGIPQGNPSAELPGQESVPVEQPASGSLEEAFFS